MKIRLKKFKGAGDVQTERLILDVLRNDDIGKYAIFRTRNFNSESVSTRVKDTYWFPDKPIREEDLIVLYTKSGVQSEKKNQDGSTSHFFYWGLSEPIWDVPGHTAILLSIEDWDTLVTNPPRSTSR